MARKAERFRQMYNAKKIRRKLFCRHLTKVQSFQKNLFQNFVLFIFSKLNLKNLKANFIRFFSNGSIKFRGRSFFPAVLICNH